MTTDHDHDHDEADRLHYEKVKDARGDLWEHLHAAQEEIRQALKTYHRLSKGDAWDVEYECAGSFEQHLMETSRLLVITRALMPTAGDTSTNVDRQLTETVAALMSNSHLK